MRRIEYPSDLEALKQDYLLIFNDSLSEMQEEWADLRDLLRALENNTPESHHMFPDEMKSLLVADYEFLVDVFMYYLKMVEKHGERMNGLHERLTNLFNYCSDGSTFPKFQPDISSFFMKHQQDLNLYVCYYCELSYINSYGFTSVYKDIGQFLKGATRHQIERYVRREDGKRLSERKYNRIMRLQKEPGVSASNIEEHFNNLDVRWRGTVKKSDRVKEMLRNHFDLDHFLPKSKCPLVALSLMNFVPCCSVCNEKLKGDDILWGENKTTRKDVLMKVSPISYRYDLDANAKMKLNDHEHGWLRAQDHPDDYSLEFKSSDPDYQSEVIDEFHLDERYGCHKCEALRWHDLMNDYPTSRIQEMAVALNGYKTEAQLRNDIFQMDYFDNNVRCFDKLRRDILGI